jgi:hypothetical protein
LGPPCFVQATIIDGDGAPHTIKRTPKTDYGKKQDCETKLKIDGTEASGDRARGPALTRGACRLKGPRMKIRPARQ